MTHLPYRHLRSRMAMSLVCHFIVVTPCNIHGKGCPMLHHFAGSTIQVADLVNCNCPLLEDGNYVCSYSDQYYGDSMWNTGGGEEEKKAVTSSSSSIAAAEVVVVATLLLSCTDNIIHLLCLLHIFKSTSDGGCYY